MHRMPLWGAIFIEFLLIFVAIGSNNSEYILIIIINLIFIVASIIKSNRLNRENIEGEKALKDIIYRDSINKMIENNDPELLYNLSLLTIMEPASSQDQINDAVKILIYCAKKGYIPAIDLLKTTNFTEKNYKID